MQESSHCIYPQRRARQRRPRESSLKLYQQNNRKEIAFSGEWQDAALRGQEIRLYLYPLESGFAAWSWCLGGSVAGKARERQGLRSSRRKME